MLNILLKCIYFFETSEEHSTWLVVKNRAKYKPGPVDNNPVDKST